MRRNIFWLAAICAAFAVATPGLAAQSGSGHPGALPSLRPGPAREPRAQGNAGTLPRVVSGAPRRHGRALPSGCGVAVDLASCRAAHVPIGFFALSPFFYPVLLSGDDYARPEAPAPGASKLIEVAPGASGEVVEIQRVGRGALRLTRPSGSGQVASVRLFVADSARRVIAEQRFTDAPYSALFSLSPRAAFVGAEVTYVGGASTVTWLPYMASR